MSTHTRPDYVRNRGDSYLPLETTFRTEPDRPTDDGNPIDLTDALSVRFYLEHPDRDEVIVNDSAEIDDAATGAVSYQLVKHQLSRTGTHAGLFIARFEGEQQWSAPRGGRVIRVEVEDIPDADGEPIDLEKVDVSIGVLEANEVIADSGGFGELSVSSAPTTETDVVREAERQALANDIGAVENDVSTLDQEKADRVGDDLDLAELSGEYSDKVRGITSGGAISIDPTGTTTPVQDTIDAVKANGGGTVIVPPTTVSEDTEPVLPSYVSLLGHGIEVSTIEVQNPTQSLLTINDDTDITPGSLSIDGIAFDGKSATLTKGAIYHPSETANVNIGQIKVRSFVGKAWLQEDAAFQLTCDQFLANNFDAGAESTGAMHFAGGGRAQKFDMLSIYPKDFDSGQDSSILTFDSENGPDMTIDYLNVGGTAGRILDQGPFPFTLRGCNYEPVDKNSTPHSLFKLGGQAPAHIQGVRMTTGPSFDYVYSLEGGSSVRKKIMGPARVHNVSPINVVSIDNDLFGGACQFQGSTADVDNNYGTTAVPLYCLDGEVS